MSSKWEMKRLDELISIKGGFSYKGKFIGSGDSLLLGMGCVSFNETFLDEGARSYSGDCKKSYFIKPGDIIIATRQQSENLPILGSPAILPEKYAGKKVIVGTNLYQVTNKSEVANEFLYWLLKSPSYKTHIKSRSKGTTVRMITKDAVESFYFKLPPRRERKWISDFLWDIQNKIELNRNINSTLEAMAQAIFKSWFVDFDPVRAKMEAKSAGRDPDRAAMAAIAGVTLDQDWDEIEAALEQKLSRMSDDHRTRLRQTAKLFPDELVESEIGEVPKGWGVKTAEEVLKRFRAPKRIKKDEVEETGKVVVLEQGEDIIMGYHDDEAGFNATPEIPYFIFGDHTCITHLVIEPFDIAPNVIPLQGEEFDSYWTYYAIRDLQQFQEYRRHWSELKVKEVVTPNNGLDHSFAEIIKPLIIKINENRNENLTLSQLRDTLLPKLISGEVGV